MLCRFVVIGLPGENVRTAAAWAATNSSVAQEQKRRKLFRERPTLVSFQF